MDRDLTTPADRVRWAVAHSGRTLQDIASAIGCSHVSLSLWQTGKTNIYNTKVGLLLAFARETGASVDWLLTGDGPRLSGYGPGRNEPALISIARHIAQDLPEQTVATAQRLLEALEPPPPPYQR